MSKTLHGLLRKSCIIFFLLFGGIRLIGQSTPMLSNPSACNLNLPITDNNCPDNGVYYQPDAFDIQVTNAPGSILGVNVYLQEVQLTIRHSWAGDLDIMLMSPGGQTIILTSDNGGGDDNYGDPDDPTCTIHARFAVGACTPVEQGIAPFTATVYRPEGDFYAFNDSITNPNGIWRLFICDDIAFDVGTLEYVNLVFAPLDCLPISEVQVLETDTTTVQLGWLPADFCGTAIIEYGPTGFTPGVNFTPGAGGMTQFGDCPPFFLTGLDPDTDYDVYIRRYCDNATFSINTCGTSIHTGCDPPPVTIVEDFNAQTDCAANCPVDCNLTGKWRNVPGDDHDWLAYSGSTPTLGTGPTDDLPGGGKYVYIETTGNSCAFGSKAYLQSGCIQLNKQGTDTCHLSFNYHMFGTNIGTLRLEVSTNGGFAWSTLWQKTGSQGNQWNKEYLSLQNFTNGTVLQFRFVGIKGTGSRGDIALDNIVFYGSAFLDFPDTQYYVDADHDGYGKPGNYVLSCLASPPVGYIDNNLDCNDNNPNINPGRPEIPCDNIDNNCNGLADDPILPTPVVTSDTICSLEPAVICAVPPAGYQILWYGSPTGDDLLFFGNCFNPVLPANNTPAPIEYKFYATATNFTCFSSVRAEAVVVVNPRPAVSSPDTPAVCPGDSFNLNAITIIDDNFTGGTITFHSGSPATPANQLIQTTVAPTVPTSYYFLSTTDMGCTGQGSVLIAVNDQPGIALSPADSFSLCKDAQATISAQGQGGSGNYNYAWSNGQTNASIDVQAGTQAGSSTVYGVTVTDDLGCQANDSVIVTTTNSIDSIKRQVVNVTSCSGSNGSITLTPLNGLPPFSYAWSGSSGVMGNISGINGAYTIANLPQGEYRITVTDNSSAMCQLVLRSVLVQGPAAVVEDIDITHVTCPGGANGSICLDISGGNPQILWSTMETTPCISGLAGGTYSVTVTDGACETILSDLQVEEPQTIKIKTDPTPPTCYNTCNGSINITVFDGTPGYFYLWSNNKTTQDINQLCPGTYTVTVTDARGCTQSETVVLTAPDTLKVNLISQANISCFGQVDGELFVSGQGGTPAYTYAWNTGSNASGLVGLSQGNYSVTVHDFNGCQRNAAFAITEPQPLTAATIQMVLPDCVGDTTGMISVTGVGGTPPYSYQWDITGSGNTIDHLGVGTYTVSVTDSRGCTAPPLQVTLTPASALNLGIAVNPPPCVGPSNGTITLSPMGTPPFSYHWQRGDMTAQIGNVMTGEYPVTITDGRGCIYDTSVVVTAPQVFNLDLNPVNPSCAGVTDGIIDVLLIQTGTPPYFFHWNDGSTAIDRSGLSAGSFQLTVTDILGCRYVSDSVELTAPSPLVLKIEALGDIACYGDSTAFVEMNVVGGTPPYSYQWINLGLTDEDVYNLPAGDYRVVILDAKGCPIDTIFSFGSPDPLNTLLELNSGDLCSPTATDTLHAIPEGGTPPYTFHWSNGAMTQSIISPTPDDYILTITDGKGCEYISPSFKVKERIPAIQLSAFEVNGISCYGEEDANITATISGGSGMYLYHFSPTYITMTDSTSVTATGLPLSNSYSVTITDINTGCVVSSGNVAAPGPDLLIITVDGFEAVNCFGGTDGSLHITPHGGTPPYNYVWTNEAGNIVSTNEDLENIPSGIYTLMLTDDHGCMASLTDSNVTHVNQVIRLAEGQTQIIPVACKGDSTGAIQIQVTGGAPPFSYEWSNMATTEDISNIPAGIYTLTVTDADTCRAIFPLLTVTEPLTSLDIDINSENPGCAGFDDGSITAVITGGGPPYDIVWERNGNILENENEPFLMDINEGNYQLTVTDTNHCVKILEIPLDDPEELSVIITTMVLPGNGQTMAIATPAGGTPDYEYHWNTGEETDSITVPQSGNYGVTVTDANDCTASESIAIVSSHTPGNEIQWIRAFPNPAKNGVWLDYLLPKPLEGSLRITGIDGRVLYHQLIHTEGISRQYIPLSDFRSGVYLLEVTAPGQGLRWLTRLVIVTQ